MSFHKVPVFLILLVVGVMLVVPVSATYHDDTFYATNESDGGLYRTSDAAFNTMRDAAGELLFNDSATSNFVATEASTTSEVYSNLVRFGFCTNSSDIPDDATVNSVTFNFNMTATQQALGEFSIGITQFTPDDPTSLVKEDFNNFGDTRYATDFPRLSLDSMWNDILFNAAGLSAINKTGYTCIILRTNNDIDNTSTGLTWLSNGKDNVKAFQTESVTSKPYLSVNWSDAVPVYYYAYGDSVTRANTAGGDLAEDGSDSYVFQMRDNHNATAGAGHNWAPASHTSTQALANISANYDTDNLIYIIEFGLNDDSVDIEDWNTTAMNLKAMHDYVEGNGSRALISIMTQYNVSHQDQIVAVQNNLTDNNVCYMKMWDALDADPLNGVLDAFDSTYYLPDNVHPNKTGEYLMGEYVWGVLNGTIESNCNPPVASFTTNTTSGILPLGVAFTDTSTNTPTDWDWYINDVKFSDLQNPEYTFTEAGVYDVSLYAANGASGDWENKTGYITVTGSGAPVQCQNQTGNITLALFFNSTTSLGWQWSDPVNITQIAEDGLFVTNFDNSSSSFIGTGYTPESWHKLKIYNETDFGQLNCTTDAVPITPTPIPIMPSTESNNNPVDLFSYWPYGLFVLGILLVIRW